MKRSPKTIPFNNPRDTRLRVRHRAQEAETQVALAIVARLLADLSLVTVGAFIIRIGLWGPVYYISIIRNP